MRKIRLWIFLGAMWVAKKACVYGYTHDHLNLARASEQNFGNTEVDGWLDF
jgi:hypothetical protein